MVFATEFFHFSFEIILPVIAFHFVASLLSSFIVQYTAIHDFDVASGLLVNQAHTNMVNFEHLLE